MLTRQHNTSIRVVLALMSVPLLARARHFVETAGKFLTPGHCCSQSSIIWYWDINWHITQYTGHMFVVLMRVEESKINAVLWVS